MSPAVDGLSVTSDLLPPGPPSAPRSIVSQVNDTMVTLEWSEPLDRGGRGDLTYGVLCSGCGTATATKVRPPETSRSRITENT